MARGARVDLRSFQQELSARLVAKTSAQVEASRLGFICGGRQWMFRLADAGEVLAVPTITPVPLTRNWYLGVANIRGNLYSVVDFAGILGMAPTRLAPQSRLIVLAARFGDIRAGLLVERVVGLRRLSAYREVGAAADAPSWGGQRWEDEAGTSWQELDVLRLVRDPLFLQVGR